MIKKIIKFLKNLFKRDSMILKHNEVKKILLETLKDRYTEKPITILSDGNYTLISESTVKSIYKKSGIRRKRYEPEVYDCDDFSLDLKSVIVEAGRMTQGIVAPYAFGIVYGYIPTPHAINWFINDKKELKFLEPQSGEIFAPKGDNIMFLYT